MQSIDPDKFDRLADRVKILHASPNVWRRPLRDRMIPGSSLGIFKGENVPVLNLILKP